MSRTFKSSFAALTGFEPLPWQASLNDRFVSGNIPNRCDIPTGLGKTSVIAIWLIALANGRRNMPRRLVYVVNRRTVVDQTSDEVEKLRNNLRAAGLWDSLRQLGAWQQTDDESPLATSTLRGQFADNQQWSTDPARPAVICGTVDMIGSRLLFSGYRIGFKSKPLHAGFLGQDVLLVHDEAHLEPAFQELVEKIQDEQRRERNGVGQEVTWPELRVLALSATARDAEAGSNTDDSAIELSDQDRQHPVVKQRVEATKNVTLIPIEDENKDLVDAIVKQATTHAESGRAVLIFARSVKAVEDIVKKLPDDATKALTGTLRGWERDNELITSPVFQRFLPKSNRDTGIKPADGTVYLVCTSAGEVGVNISADHLVCDLSTFDSMAQRFGRVNRFGERKDTRIDVFHPTSFERKGKVSEVDERRERTLDLLNQLNGDASPQALGRLDAASRTAAFAPEPTILPASDILFDAWSLTTIRDKMPGRPPVAPYLHGVTEWDPPQTEVAWRHEVDVIKGDLAERYSPKDLLENYPLKPHELLKDRSDRVFKALDLISKRCPDAPVWLVSDDGSVDPPLSIQGLADKNTKDRINGRTILLPPSVGGLSGGLLDGKAKYVEEVQYDVAELWTDEHGRQRRVRIWDDVAPPDGFALIRTIDTDPDAGEFATATDAPETSTGGKRLWHWYIRPRDAEDVTRASTEPITLEHHTRDVVERTRQLVASLQVDNESQQALVLAAELHDLGKRRELWQRGIGNPDSTEGNWYAKPGKPKEGKRWRPRHISSYRHEFGSLLDILDAKQEFRARFEQLSDCMQELVLHVIAAHHGRARPHFPADESFDPNPGSDDGARDQTLETPVRFSRLQRRYGRWGLAYVESLLRAADWAASAEPSEAEENNS